MLTGAMLNDGSLGGGAGLGLYSRIRRRVSFGRSIRLWLEAAGSWGGACEDWRIRSDMGFLPGLK